jgi:hypothetical protein
MAERDPKVQGPLGEPLNQDEAPIRSSQLVDESLATIMAIIGRDFGVKVEVVASQGKEYTTESDKIEHISDKQFTLGQIPPRGYTNIVEEGKVYINLRSNHPDIGKYNARVKQIVETHPNKIMVEGMNPVLSLLVADYQRRYPAAHQ